MIQYIIRKLFYGFLVLFGVVTLLFFLFNLLPADPARMMLGQRADEEAIANLNKELGRDKPLFYQYIKYLNDLSPISIHQKTETAYFSIKSDMQILADFDFKTCIVAFKLPYLNRSYQSKRPVLEIVNSTLPATFLLAIMAMLFSTVVGILLGIASALYKGRFIDHFLSIISVFGMAAPSFFMALIIMWIFGHLLGDFTGLNRTGSLYVIDDLGRGEYIEWKNLILPAFTLGLRPLAVIVQLTRNSMLDVLNMDYIRTAKAKGLKRLQVLFKHALKNSLNPVITAISGWLAGLLAGSVFVEWIFGWKGLGSEIVNALDNYDLPVVMGSVLIIAAMFVIINILVDIIYGIIDPRVRIN